MQPKGIKMYELAIKAKNYKCFKDEAGFDVFRRVNLIIGRNNAGKSSLLDLIEIVTSGKYEFDRSTWRDSKSPQIIFEAIISEKVVNKVFPSGQRGGFTNIDHLVYGKKYIGRILKWSKHGSAANNAVLLESDYTDIHPPLKNSGTYAGLLPNNMPIPIQGKMFRRLLAERDILPEVAQTNNVSIDNNGTGLTNAIQNFINSSSLPSELVEVSILGALNTIFAHDAIFTDIVCQLHENNRWEIYLEEKHKGRIALSQSGSGLKTVISVLACLILVPHLEGKPISEYIFGFEELENNIHPALLRRLNDYIYKSALDNDFSYVLTTHSNVLIDQFSKQKDAQIIHVTHKNSISTCTTVSTYVENNGILDDLDVRASDLLQANGIIWVEGPSDRIYLNRWIGLWSNDELKEGTHYQIIFYGGRLLSHLSADEPSNIESGISILNTNRNAIILIDSDKKNQQTPINATKERIKEEFSKMKAYCWITKGKEIENYISSDVVDEFWNIDNSEQVNKYDSFFEHLDNITSGEGTKYSSKKPLLAENLISHMTKDNLESVLDIKPCMDEVCKIIRSWNS